MKAPICIMCLNSDILCTACQKRLEEGRITESDISVSRLINKLSGRIRVLKDAEIKKVIESDSTLIIVSERGKARNLVGKDGLAVRKISEAAGKNVRVVEETDDIREFIQRLLFPVPVLTINVLYSGDKEIIKVVVEKKRRLPLSPEEFGKIMKKVFDKKVRIVFSR